MKINNNLETAEITDFNQKYRGDKYITITCCMDDLYLEEYTIGQYLELGKRFFDAPLDPWLAFCGINDNAKEMLEAKVKELNGGKGNSRDLINLLAELENE